jgi:hypothetical protein
LDNRVAVFILTPLIVEIDMFRLGSICGEDCCTLWCICSQHKHVVLVIWNHQRRVRPNNRLWRDTIVINSKYFNADHLSVNCVSTGANGKSNWTSVVWLKSPIIQGLFTSNGKLHSDLAEAMSARYVSPVISQFTAKNTNGTQLNINNIRRGLEHRETRPINQSDLVCPTRAHYAAIKGKNAFPKLLALCAPPSVFNLVCQPISCTTVLCCIHLACISTRAAFPASLRPHVRLIKRH